MIKLERLGREIAATVEGIGPGTCQNQRMDRLGLYPENLAGDSAYGIAEMVGWLVE